MCARFEGKSAWATQQYSSGGHTFDKQQACNCASTINDPPPCPEYTPHGRCGSATDSYNLVCLNRLAIDSDLQNTMEAYTNREQAPSARWVRHRVHPMSVDWQSLQDIVDSPQGLPPSPVSQTWLSNKLCSTLRTFAPYARACRDRLCRHDRYVRSSRHRRDCLTAEPQHNQHMREPHVEDHLLCTFCPCKSNARDRIYISVHHSYRKARNLR